MIECRDGWVQLVGHRATSQWERLLASPDAGDLADPRLSTTAARGQPTWLPRLRRSSRGAGRGQGRRRAHPRARSAVRSARTPCPPICCRRRSSRTASSSATSTTAAAVACAARAAVPALVDARRAGLGAGARLVERIPAAPVPPADGRAGARPRRHPRARLHVGRGRAVRDVPARAARRRRREGRVDPPPRSGAARLPRRLRRDQPVAEFQRDQPQQAVVPGRPVPAEDGLDSPTGSSTGPTSSSTTSVPA